MSADLLKCPFCGSAPKVENCGAWCDNDDCAIVGTIFSGGARHWNRRAEPVAQASDSDAWGNSRVKHPDYLAEQACKNRQAAAMLEKLAQASAPPAFCWTCGKRLYAGSIHTCTPPDANAAPASPTDAELLAQIFKSYGAYKIAMQSRMMPIPFNEWLARLADTKSNKEPK